MNKDKESHVKIFFTKDYDQFQVMEGNRGIVPRKIKKLKESVLENGLDMFKYCPIIVNENMEVIDGQHRYTVCMELNIPIFYVINSNGIHIKQVAEMNNNTDKWKSMDFVECFQKQGNTHYIELIDFLNEHGYTISISAALLMRGRVADSLIAMNHVKNGTFKIKFKANVDSFLTWIDPLIKHADSPKSKSFLIAMQDLYASDKFDIELLLEKLNKSKRTIEHQVSRKLYLSHIEEHCNFKNSKRITIY